MKKFVLSLMALSLLVRCNDSENSLQSGTLDDLSLSARSFLVFQSGAQTANAFGSTSALANSAQSMATALAQANVGIADALLSATGTSQWSTCGQHSEVQNEDGSITITIDYGDGCNFSGDDYTYVQFGKSISTYKNEHTQKGNSFHNSFTSHSRYIDFGGKFISSEYDSEWRVNGTNAGEGYFSYDTLTHNYAGEFINADSTSTVVDGTSYTYYGNQNIKFEELKTIVETQSYRYTIDNDYFETLVITPVVTDYTCFASSMSADGDDEAHILPISITPVSGRIRVTYQYKGEQGSFEVDYGDGTCNDEIIIIENGKSIRISGDDLSIIMAQGLG